MQLYYTLDDNHQVQPASDIISFSIWMWEGNTELKRRVGLTHIKDLCVSTVFLGIDQALISTKPVLFETLVWYPDGPSVKRRYHTWEEAVLGHEEVVKEVTSSLN